jgi:hypothetical protein
MSIDKNINVLKRLGLSGPTIVGVAMLNVEGYELGIGRHLLGHRRAVADRNSLALPEVWLESLDTLADIDELVKPMMDVLWQSFGMEKCLEYAASGQWKPRAY